MNILVIDTAAESSGALTILREHYKQFQADTENQYFLCVSISDFKDTENIKMLNFDWVKRSWFHRLYFEIFLVNRLVSRYNVEQVLSLQNTALFRKKKILTVYCHQTVPFSEIRFKLRQNRGLWIYQNIIGRLIFRSLKKADKIIVQTQWLKQAIVERLRISQDKIEIAAPNVTLVEGVEPFKKEAWKGGLFYPASNLEYKNHGTVFRALKRLMDSGVNDVTLYITLTQEEVTQSWGKEYTPVREYVQVLGSIEKKRVFELYSTCALVFPSYIESFGLPLLEARMMETFVAASNCPFSREILKGYDKAWFFDPFCESELYDILVMLFKNMKKS